MGNNSDVMNIVRFPFERTVGPVSNDPRQEFLFELLDGHPPAKQKRAILRARSAEVAFLDDQGAEILISALGLEGV